MFSQSSKSRSTIISIKENAQQAFVYKFDSLTEKKLHFHDDSLHFDCLHVDLVPETMLFLCV